ncbi:hypothetical protein [Bacillus wiedmannii]|uniref:hypothetical protein n=1 Tax=Bacillus wiedmannii TaxID=1890302 RepID=UPI00114566AE|nr:hypothetical protein [Bacillus wiedmannii]
MTARLEKFHCFGGVVGGKYNHRAFNKRNLHFWYDSPYRSLVRVVPYLYILLLQHNPNSLE